MVPLLCPARKNIFFDLDGTLLPMDMDQYLRIYIEGLSVQIPQIPPKDMFNVLWEGILAMIKNDGAHTNREVFAQVFTARTGIDYYENEDRFLQFYLTDYQKGLAACSPTPLAAQIISVLQKKGYNVVIATSPLYPAVAAQSRVNWAGLGDFTFPMITTFDDFHAAKPNPHYYQELCEKLHVAPEACIMVGNDAEEDGAARQVGMDVIMLTDCLINKRNLPLDDFYVATLGDVLLWAEGLPALV